MAVDSEKYARYKAKKDVHEWGIVKGQETTLSADEFKAKKDSFEKVEPKKK